MRKFMSRKVIAVVTVVGVLAVAGAAFAFFTGGGSGTGTAGVGTSGTVTLTATVTPGIVPGTSEPVSFTAANATNSGIQVTTVHLDGITVDSGHAACVTDDFSMADVPEAHEVPALATAEALPNDGTLVYADTGVSQDACQGATLTLTLSSAGATG
jgi:hypothetical protein